MNQKPRVTIGDVAESLSSEFPDVTVSKIRFLESEGLINPPRSAAGYREFGPPEIDRIRYILRQQRDHFLPLKVIKEKLASWDRGATPQALPEAGPPPDAYFAPVEGVMSPEEAAQSAGAPVAIIAELMRHGVLEPADPINPTFDEDDVVVIRASYRLIGHGLEARHLRTIRLGANREVDLFRQLTGPMLRHATPASRRQAAEVLADVAQAAREMQEAMVKGDLRETLGR